MTRRSVHLSAAQVCGLENSAPASTDQRLPSVSTLILPDERLSAEREYSAPDDAILCHILPGGSMYRSGLSRPYDLHATVRVIEPLLPVSRAPAAQLLAERWKSGEETNQFNSVSHTARNARLAVQFSDLRLKRPKDCTDNDALAAGARAVPGGYTFASKNLPASDRPALALIAQWRDLHATSPARSDQWVWLARIHALTRRKPGGEALREIERLVGEAELALLGQQRLEQEVQRLSALRREALSEAGRILEIQGKTSLNIGSMQLDCRGNLRTAHS